MGKNLVEIIVTAEDKASGVLKGIGGTLGGIGRLATGAALGGIALVAGGMALAGRAAIGMNADLESSTLQFETLMGDSDRAAEHVASLFEFAAKTPFETGPIIEASRVMQVFGGDALNTEENLTRIGDTAAAVGAPIEDIGFWVGRAYAAIQGGQPFGEAAQNLMQMGAVSPAVIARMNELKESGASNDEIFKVLTDSFDEFGGAMEKQAGTWQGLMSTIKDSLNMAAATALKPFFDLAKKGLAGLAEWFNSPAIQAAIAALAEKLTVIIQAVADFVSGIMSGEDPVGDFANLFWRLSGVFGATEEQAKKVFEIVRKVGDGFIDFTTPIIAFVQTHGPLLKQILAGIAIGFAAFTIISTVVGWISGLVAAMSALGGAITAAGGVLSFIVGILGGPVTIVIGLVAGAIALLKLAWDNNWGGIQEKTAAAWAVIQPILAMVIEWVGVKVREGMEQLRAFWVDVAWPAIQNAIAVVWPVIQAIFQAISTFITGTLIPTLQSLWQKWTVDVWPVIQTVTQNVWTIIEEIFRVIGVWINDNIIPWIEELQRIWAEVVWPAIQKALEAAWAIIEPIWEAIRKWAAETLPPVINALKGIFETVMSGISAAIAPVKAVWDGFVNAIKSFWDWISSHTFEFHIGSPPAAPGVPGGRNRAGLPLIGGGVGAIALGGKPAAGGMTIVNIDARRAERGVDRDLKAMVEEVMRNYGAKADIRMRTS